MLFKATTIVKLGLAQISRNFHDIITLILVILEGKHSSRSMIQRILNTILQLIIPYLVFGMFLQSLIDCGYRVTQKNLDSKLNREY